MISMIKRATFTVIILSLCGILWILFSLFLFQEKELKLLQSKDCICKNEQGLLRQSKDSKISGRDAELYFKWYGVDGEETARYIISKDDLTRYAAFVKSENLKEVNKI